MNDPNLPEPLPSAWRTLLLHRLPDEQAQALEQRLLAEPPLLNALREAEHDLYDDYARDRLIPAERSAFEQHVLTTPEARERLRFSQALKSALTPVGDGVKEPPLIAPRHRRRAWIAVTGAALAASVVAAVVVLSRGPRPDAVQSAASTAPQTLVLLASVERGTQNAAIDLRLTNDATQVRVQAEIEQPDSSARYRLSLFADDGATTPLLRIDDLALVSAGRYRYIEALVPAQLFADGSKSIRVEAQPPAAAFTYEWIVHAAPADPG